MMIYAFGPSSATILLSRYPAKADPGWGVYNVFDPHIWLEGETYFAILGGNVKPDEIRDTAYVFKSIDLHIWTLSCIHSTPPTPNGRIPWKIVLVRISSSWATALLCRASAMPMARAIIWGSTMMGFSSLKNITG